MKQGMSTTKFKLVASMPRAPTKRIFFQAIKNPVSRN